MRQHSKSVRKMFFFLSKPMEYRIMSRKFTEQAFKSKLIHRAKLLAKNSCFSKQAVRAMKVFFYKNILLQYSVCSLAKQNFQAKKLKSTTLPVSANLLVKS